MENKVRVKYTFLKVFFCAKNERELQHFISPSLRAPPAGPISSARLWLQDGCGRDVTAAPGGHEAVAHHEPRLSSYSSALSCLATEDITVLILHADLSLKRSVLGCVAGWKPEGYFYFILF